MGQEGENVTRTINVKKLITIHNGRKHVYDQIMKMESEKNFGNSNEEHRRQDSEINKKKKKSRYQEPIQRQSV